MLLCRAGGGEEEWAGRLVPHTQCDYKLDRCSVRRCVLRSPHYPGLYPRNITCSYHVFVLPGETPPGKQVQDYRNMDSYR